MVTSVENQAKVENLKLKVEIVIGGKTRQESSFNGLKNLQAKAGDLVLFHNGANPLVTSQEIDAVIEATKKTGAAVVGMPVKGTLKKVQTEKIQATVARENVWETQTPQGIKYALALQAFQQAQKDKFEGTDDVQLVERLGLPVQIIKGSDSNLKITKPADLKLANLILASKTSRVGIGQDSHRFDTQDKPLILGGFQISATGGLKANSDGDVILHALCNALSSAIGGFSLSGWADKMYQNGITDSRKYLEKIYQKVLQNGFQIANISIALEAGKPKLEKHLPAIQKNLSELLNIETSKIGLTVTSGERLTEFGKGEGIQALVSVSLSY